MAPASVHTAQSILLVYAKVVPAISIDGKFCEGGWVTAEVLDQGYPDCPPLFACPSEKGTTRFVESFVDKVVNPSLLRLFARDAFDRMDSVLRLFWLMAVSLDQAAVGPGSSSIGSNTGARNSGTTLDSGPATFSILTTFMQPATKYGIWSPT